MAKKAAVRNNKSFEEALWAPNFRHTLLPKLISGELRIEDAEKMVISLKLMITMRMDAPRSLAPPAQS